MRTHGRKRRILLHDSDFRGKFRIVQHFSCRNAVFPPIPYPPKPVFSALFCNYGGARCSTIPKTAEKWNRATFRDTERVEAAGSMQPPQEKRIQGRLPLFPIYFNALYQRGTKSPRNVTHLDEAGDVLLGYFNTIIYYATSE